MHNHCTHFDITLLKINRGNKIAYKAQVFVQTNSKEISVEKKKFNEKANTEFFLIYRLSISLNHPKLSAMR